MLSQAELHTVNGALTALDDDLDMIQQQLEHQMQAQDQHQEDARYTFGVSCTVMHLESVLLKSCLPACQQAVPLCGSTSRRDCCTYSPHGITVEQTRAQANAVAGVGQLIVASVTLATIQAL